MLRAVSACFLLYSAALPVHAQNDDTNPGPEALALEATAAHEYAKAYEIYRNLAAEAPENAEFQIWMGRLLGYQNKLDQALQAYDAALALAPKNVDAIAGKGYILLWLHRYNDAAEYLGRAQEMAPEDSDITLAIARLYRSTNQPHRALQFVEQVLASNPRNPDALLVKDSLLPQNSLRLAVSVAGDHAPSGSAGISGSIEAAWESPLNQVAMRLENWDRYGQPVTRVGVRLGRTIRNRWIAEGSVTVGSRGDVLARFDESLSLKRKIGAGWVLGGQYRDLSFDSVHVQLAGPQVEYYFKHPIWLDGNYSRTFSHFRTQAGTPDSAAASDSFFLRYNQRIRHVVVHGGFGHGVQLFTIPSVDHLGQFQSNSFVAGLELSPRRQWTTYFDYALEHRSNGSVEQILSASVVWKGTRAR